MPSRVDRLGPVLVFPRHALRSSDHGAPDGQQVVLRLLAHVAEDCGQLDLFILLLLLAIYMIIYTYIMPISMIILVHMSCI